METLELLSISSSSMSDYAFDIDDVEIELLKQKFKRDSYPHIVIGFIQEERCSWEQKERCTKIL